MNVQSKNWLEIGRLEDIPPRGARKVKLGSVTIAVFRSANDEVFALEDNCPHNAGPLSEGIVHDDCVTCPLHNWVISLKSGEPQGADEGAVRRYSVELADGVIRLCTSPIEPFNGDAHE
ncbi:nitrite reductase small subunit NirD [Polycladidibacter hongkongensis]|uniref:nitrite reductase small subunit NirD n=1 Tax=Polycladidibacter hongkongensis TaxID=1647556 RepID=UPI00082FFC84|nr:nitrite reductase small subunit NirD [Pseudovibrio hongkongensis]